MPGVRAERAGVRGGWWRAPAGPSGFPPAPLLALPAPSTGPPLGQPPSLPIIRSLPFRFQLHPRRPPQSSFL